jgi:hypothetical protein
VTDKKKWADMTKEERAQRIKEGQAAANKRRAEPADTDVSALVAAEVQKALAAIKASPVVTGAKDPKDMSKDELRAEHDRLQAALEALPFVGDKVRELRPGMKIGEGLTQEYVPYSQSWFLDVEARRQDRNIHNGKPAELTWPNYDLYTVVYPGPKPAEEIQINGVGFALVAGVPCKLPTPHYGLYMQSLAGLRRHAEQFAPPRPSTNPGYMHVNISQSSGRPVAVLLGKGGLASMEEREAADARPASA